MRFIKGIIALYSYVLVCTGPRRFGVVGYKELVVDVELAEIIAFGIIINRIETKAEHLKNVSRKACTDWTEWSTNFFSSNYCRSQRSTHYDSKEMSMKSHKGDVTVLLNQNHTSALSNIGSCTKWFNRLLETFKANKITKIHNMKSQGSKKRKEVEKLKIKSLKKTLPTRIYSKAKLTHKHVLINLSSDKPKTATTKERKTTKPGKTSPLLGLKSRAKAVKPLFSTSKSRLASKKLQLRGEVAQAGVDVSSSCTSELPPGSTHMPISIPSMRPQLGSRFGHSRR